MTICFFLFPAWTSLMKQTKSEMFKIDWIKRIEDNKCELKWKLWKKISQMKYRNLSSTLDPKDEIRDHQTNNNSTDLENSFIISQFGHLYWIKHYNVITVLDLWTDEIETQKKHDFSELERKCQWFCSDHSAYFLKIIFILDAKSMNDVNKWPWHGKILMHSMHASAFQ